jgi:hypothetical protein
MILLTGFYLDPDPARRGEFLECIRQANDAFDEIHVFTENPVDAAQIRSDTHVCLLLRSACFQTAGVSLIEISLSTPTDICLASE